MLPTLSRLSVRHSPEDRLRHWCSSRYLRISPLHREFHSPLRSSSQTLSSDPSQLSREISPRSYLTAYTPFTPSKSGQRLPPTYYRGCWHVVSRGFLSRYCQNSSRVTEVYDPKAFIPHAALLRHGFPHCGRFSTAASRRSLGSVSVPVWPDTLSGRLAIIVLVGRYPTNKLIARGPLLKRQPKPALITR